MNLHHSADEFEQLILLAGEHFGIRPVYIEKEHWVTFV